jgi:quercetin dioxygenase-like cupin family protein
MTFIDISTLCVIERAPGWFGRIFHSPSMTFAQYEFRAGSSVHEHHHPEEEVWQVIEGEAQITVGGESRVVGPGGAAIVPGNVRHSLLAITDGRAIVVDHPVRLGPELES